MKVIELLTKIANGEDVPTIIKYKHKIWTYRNDVKDYTDETQFFFGEYIFQDDTQKELNNKVEIIEDKEDKKIETIDLSEWSEITYQEDWDLLTKDFNRNSCLFVNKINKLIDKVKSMEEKINGIVGEEETD